MCMYGCGHTCHGMCGGQRLTFRSQVSHSFVGSRDCTWLTGPVWPSQSTNGFYFTLLQKSKLGLSAQCWKTFKTEFHYLFYVFIYTYLSIQSPLSFWIQAKRWYRLLYRSTHANHDRPIPALEQPQLFVARLLLLLALHYVSTSCDSIKCLCHL